VPATGCEHRAAGSADDLARQAGACAGQPVPPAAGRQFVKGCTLIEQGVASGDAHKATKLLGRAAKTLRKAGKLTARAAHRKRAGISSDCAGALDGILGGARSRAERLKGSR
jgi:hypothetical protein